MENKISTETEPSSMKAIQITEPGKVELIEVSKPEPGRGELLLKIDLIGFCGSDLSTYLGRNPLVSYPRIPGHEVAATIVGKGREVPAGFEIGDMVTVMPYTSCGKCASCRRGRFNACEHNQTMGVQRDGAMREYITVPYGKVLKTPLLSSVEAALIEPLTVGFHAVDRAEVTPEDTVLVLGCGMIGAGAIAASSLRNATVIAVDIEDEKLQTAMGIGAAHLINSAKEDLHEALQRILDGNAPDVVVEAAGNPVTYKAAIDEVAFAGRMVCIGYSKSDVTLATKLWVQKELDIRGSRNAMPEDFDDVKGILEAGAFPVQEVITKVVTPEQAADAFQEWADAPGKVFKIFVEF